MFSLPADSTLLRAVFKFYLFSIGACGVVKNLLHVQELLALSARRVQTEQLLPASTECVRPVCLIIRRCCKNDDPCPFLICDCSNYSDLHVGVVN